MTTIKPLLLAVVLGGAGALALPAAELGKVTFENSGSPAAQEPFLRGVAALHNFFYDEAEEAFQEAQKADPGFALAYWGEAMTYNHPIWSEQDRDAALAALQRLAPTAAERAAKAPTEREKGFLEAVEILYGEGDKEVRDAAYRNAMRALHERWPQDLEAASFYCLSLIGPALTGPAGSLRDRVLIEAAAILEELFDRNREHPGVLHYMIHAYDDPLHAPLGLRAARLYAKTAPAAHHARHMPSHIFVQLGDWPATAASNEDAWQASVDWVARREHPIEKRDFHSLSWLLYAYLQQGRLAKARETLKTVEGALAESDVPRIASAARSMEATYLLATHGYNKELLSEGEEPHGGHAHAGMPQRGGNDGSVALAVGLGALRAGDLATAQLALSKLAPAEEGGDTATRYGGAAGVAAKELAGMIQLAEGKTEDGLKLLAEAAELEAKMPPPMGPPVPIKPAQELYGEALLGLGRAEEAAAQFDQALLRMPNRTASLLGSARAAVKLGKTDLARTRYAALAAIWKDADPELAEAREAKGYRGEESRPAAR